MSAFCVFHRWTSDKCLMRRYLARTFESALCHSLLLCNASLTATFIRRLACWHPWLCQQTSASAACPMSEVQKFFIHFVYCQG